MRRFLVVLALGIAACSKSAGMVAEDAGTSVAPVPKAAPPPESLADQVRKATTLEAALAIAQPEMEDTHNSLDKGTAALTIWGIKAMRWSDVGVAQDETSFALVQKDSDEARAKRLCATGSLISIEIQKTEAGKFFDAMMTDHAGHIYQLYAVGSTGPLVARSAARFCGVVTGKFEYSNSGGGTGHAIKLVGMFDLPMNTP